MNGEAQKSALKLKNFTLFFFATVGFVASITTIAAFFDATPRSALKVELTPYHFSIPKYVASYFVDDSSTRKMAKDVKNTLCKGMDSNELIRLEESELQKVEIKGKKPDEIRLCRDAHALDFVGRWSNAFSTNPGSLIFYKVENVGSDIAKEIRLSGSNINSAQIRRGSEYIEIKKKDGEESYPIPNLNPRESIDIYVWSNLPSLSENLWYKDSSDYPSITHSGSSTDISLYKPVKGFWLSLAEFFDGMPIFIAVIVIIVISVLIAGVVIIFVSVVVSILKGEGVSGAFKGVESGGSVSGASEKAE